MSSKARPSKSKSKSKSASVIEFDVAVLGLLGGLSVPRSFARVSSASDPSLMVVDCFKLEPFTFLVDASSDVDESFETNDKDEPLGVCPDLCDVT
jgi:hypothetical protein